jgi:predicted nucleotidyltransferase component of viral defense system
MLNHTKHKEFMLAILQKTFRHPIGEYLGFKGGTLAFLVHGLDRFSTDIDIDLLDLSQEQALLSAMRNILLELGEIKNETLGKDLHRWIFRYDQSGMNIKVEINKRQNTDNEYEYHTIADTQVRCMNQSSMVANKVVALYNRMYNRDLFDVHFFFKHNFECKEETIIHRTGLQLHQVYQKLIQEIPLQFTPTKVLAGLGELITDAQKPRVKNHLATETTKLLQLYLDTH